MQTPSVRILGLMSGTSLDGLDLCLCSFSSSGGKLSYTIEASETVTYPDSLAERLKYCHLDSAEHFLLLHNEFGRYCGDVCKAFLVGKPQPAAIASHGHTVFHQPDRMFTFQIGSGASIMAQSGLDTICDFRTSDVAFGGQGAPLVPIGDMLLFGDYDYCLNIGGFANISSIHNNQSLAYDICAANFVLNELCGRLGLPYDDGGMIARNSKCNSDLLFALNKLDFYALPAPKSLGREWAELKIFPVLTDSGLKSEDLIATYTEHIAVQVARCITKDRTVPKMLVTGGGAHNHFLLERIVAHSGVQICTVTEQIVNFKEALIFALLGYLFLQGQNNCLSEITGASVPCIGGALYKAPKKK